MTPRRLLRLRPLRHRSFTFAFPAAAGQAGPVAPVGLEESASSAAPAPPRPSRFQRHALRGHGNHQTAATAATAAVAMAAPDRSGRFSQTLPSQRSRSSLVEPGHETLWLVACIFECAAWAGARVAGVRRPGSSVLRCSGPQGTARHRHRAATAEATRGAHDGVGEVLEALGKLSFDRFLPRDSRLRELRELRVVRELRDLRPRTCEAAAAKPQQSLKRPAGGFLFELGWVLAPLPAAASSSGAGSSDRARSGEERRPGKATAPRGRSSERIAAWPASTWRKAAKDIPALSVPGLLPKPVLASPQLLTALQKESK